MEDALSTRSLLAARTQLATVQQAIALFGQAAQAGGHPADLDAETIAKLRAECALPVVAGMLNAAAQFIWLTAPAGGTLGGLLATMLENAEIAAHRIAAEDTAPGEYWVQVATTLAAERARG